MHTQKHIVLTAPSLSGSSLHALLTENYVLVLGMREALTLSYTSALPVPRAALALPCMAASTAQQAA